MQKPVCQRDLARMLSLIGSFLLQKEAWGGWQYREMTFFCAILKSVPLEL